MASADYLKLCKDAYDSSTTYVDANYRKNWEDSLRMFQSKHPKDSKYLSDSFKYRSKIFRPKTRSVVRKNEAAAAAAFFANKDVLSTEAVNPMIREQSIGADLMKEVLNYRLQRTIPWFQILIGAIQDAQVVGVVASYQYWKYKEKVTMVEQPTIDAFTGLPAIGEDGKPMTMQVEQKEVIEDKPCIELIPIENIRIDPAADWLDPIGSSPYVIRLIPMYAMDVKSMMTSEDPKTGKPKWKKYEDAELRKAASQDDSTRAIRNKDRVDPADEEKPLTDYEIVWVHENFFRGEDGVEVVYSLGVHHLLTGAVPLKEIYFHGEIPVTLGCAVIESHRSLPSSLVELGGELQREANEIANQRLDNVKLALNKRFIAKRGAQVDLQSLVRNVPGSVTLATDPTMDVREVEFSDVTSSSYAEQDRINVDFDELVGNFSGGSVLTNRKMNETVGGMSMISAGATQLTEYMLRTFVETWVEPTLRQLVKLEAAYETDEVVLAIAANKAKLFPKYGVSQVNDSLLKQDLVLTVNVGLGATDPSRKLQGFLGAAKTYAEIMRMVPGANLEEVRNEIFGLAGYKDSQRFFPGGQQNLPPEVQQGIQQMQQQMQQMQQQLQQAQQALKDKSQELQLEQQKAQVELQMEAQDSQRKAQLEMEKLELERQVAEAQLALRKYEIELENKLKTQMGREKAMVEREKNTQSNVTKQASFLIQPDQSTKTALNDVTKSVSELYQSNVESQNAFAQVASQVMTATQQLGDSVRSLSDSLNSVNEKVDASKDDVKSLYGALSKMDMKLAAAAANKPKRARIKRGPNGTEIELE